MTKGILEEMLVCLRGNKQKSITELKNGTTVAPVVSYFNPLLVSYKCKIINGLVNQQKIDNNLFVCFGWETVMTFF